MTNPDFVTREFRSTKLQSWHLDRIAVVYVRQSSPQQVAENRESTQRQYSLSDRARELGWRPDRIVIIDEDQGKSGSTAEDRLGFQRLLAEVSLDHVGLILGIEMSRLARSCKDWHQLLELCAIFRTLLADQDGLYDPNDPNDRLLLGLKGTMSEAELHVLRGRLRQGLLNKVRRGEVFLSAPTGYVRSPQGDWELDPDEQVQSVVRLIFELFERCGRARKVAFLLQEQGVKLGIRRKGHADLGTIEWRTAAVSTITKILKHPVYAGYYVYGRHRTDPRRKTSSGRTGSRRRVPATDYLALIPGVCPAYISQETYTANQRKLAANRARYEFRGAPREGTSLLAGILRCGKCGRRMSTAYCGSNNILRYFCNRMIEVERPCIHQFAGNVLDSLVADQVLRALQPAALELSLAAMDDVLHEHAVLDQNWQQRLERTQLEADRAGRQYHSVEPENRLVARTLERRWEIALHEVRQLEEDYARFQQTTPLRPTSADTRRLRALARDLPALWHAPTTQPIDRQQIIRILIEEVEVIAPLQTDRMQATITWAGGQKTQHEAMRPVKCYEQKSDFPQLLTRVKELFEMGTTCESIATRLNAEGFHPAYGSSGFSKKNVGTFIRKFIGRKQVHPTRTRVSLNADEWLVPDLARLVGIGKTAFYRWVHAGWVRFRVVQLRCRNFVCWADEEEIQRLSELARTSHQWYDPKPPKRLTRPKPRPVSHILSISRDDDF